MIAYAPTPRSVESLRAQRHARGVFTQEESQERLLRQWLPKRWAESALKKARLSEFDAARDERVTPIMEEARAVAAIVPGVRCSDDDLRAQAEAIAGECRGAASLSWRDMWCMVLRVCERIGLGLQWMERGTEYVGARVIDSVFWLRHLRRVHARRLETAAIRLGHVHKRADCYASRETVERRRQQKRRNRASIDSMELVADDGEIVALSKVVEGSVANPAIRRGELMTRIRGFEEVASDVKHIGLFITLTCPSRMHSRLSMSGEENPKWDGTTPREANAYLSRVWARIRSKLQREEVVVYGFRIAEPHHDGCPHYHLLLFVSSEDAMDAVTVTEAFMDHALRDSPEEPGAQLYRVKFKAMLASKGGAASYIAKYVAKNIDGYQLEKDLFGNDALVASMHVEAWASTWGIRQFQQVGGAPVGVWREARRVDSETVATSGSLNSVIRSVNRSGEVKACWKSYIYAMGGTKARRNDFRVVMRKKTQEVNGRYGRVERVMPVGLSNRDEDFMVETRGRAWLLRRVRAPWTRVNNCTRPFAETETKEEVAHGQIERQRSFFSGGSQSPAIQGAGGGTVHNSYGALYGGERVATG